MDEMKCNMYVTRMILNPMRLGEETKNKKTRNKKQKNNYPLYSALLMSFYYYAYGFTGVRVVC